MNGFHRLRLISGGLANPHGTALDGDENGTGGDDFIRNFTISTTVCTGVTSFPYSESFESGIGSWLQSSGDDFDWSRLSGGTGSSGTGPSSAYDGSFYMYTESSSPNYPNKTAGFYNRFCFATGGLNSPMMDFAYHMYGSTMGTLTLQVSTDGSTWTDEWSLSGDQGNTWHTTTVDLSAYGNTNNVLIRWWGLTSTSYTSDMSVDDIVIYEGGPQPNGLWEGAISTDWNNMANWEDGLLPIASTNVIISSVATYWPTYSGDFVLGTQCLSLTLNGASEMTVTGDLTISNGTSIVCTNNAILKVGGDWNNNGSFNSGTGTVEFIGSNNTSLTGPPSSNVFFYDGFESNLGWNLSGEFERGTPNGLGGNYGNPDPNSAFAGSNVLGVDLSGQGTYPGDYEINLGNRAYQAISPTINCSGFTNISMNFQRWLGVESPTYDHAYIDISNDNGNNWTQIWTNTAVIQESSWGLQSIDISAYADNQSQVKIMFSIGSSDGSWQYCGWNIDEFELSGDGPGGETFYNLTINKNNAEVLTNSDVNVNGNLTVQPEAWLTNSSGITITVLGDASILGDNAGNASYIDQGSTTVAGAALVQNYYVDNRWHFISSPVSGAVSNIFLDIYLKAWHEDTYLWEFITATDHDLSPGAGFEIWSTLGNPTIDFVGGDLNTGNINIPITATDRGGVTGIGPDEDEGWNFVGNPYPSGIDLGPQEIYYLVIHGLILIIRYICGTEHNMHLTTHLQEQTSIQEHGMFHQCKVSLSELMILVQG